MPQILEYQKYFKIIFIGSFTRTLNLMTTIILETLCTYGLAKNRSQSANAKVRER